VTTSLPARDAARRSPQAGAAKLPLPLPLLFEVSVPDDWRAIDFISDLHLDLTLPKSFDAWAAHLLNTAADAVYILGDLFEVWVGDDARQRPFERRCVEVLAEATSRRQVAFMAGNRDFLVGTAMLKECGLMALPDPTVLSAWGQRVMLTHGDALCLADTDYQRFRSEVRGETWRHRFLALPLDERIGIAAGIRHASESRKQAAADPALWADIDSAAAVAWMHAVGTAEMVHGHTHRPGSETLAPGYKRHVLSDWDLDHAQPRAEVLRLTRDGFRRIAPVTALQSAGCGGD
jgi:UDP-2,3-diacylglucosamine hydrolase